MYNKLILVLTCALFFVGCKNNSFQISGKLKEPVKGEFIYLDELKANNFKTVDSLKISEDGKFEFRRDIELPTFYLLKLNDNNFFTILAEPGDKLKISARYDSLNYPQSVSGSKGTEKMMEYNKALKSTVNKLMSLREIYMQNTDSPELPKVIHSLDSIAQQYLNEINTYTKKYIDDNITSLVSLVALYQQVAPQVSVLNPVEDLNYFVKVDSVLSSRYPESEPVIALHAQVQSLITKVNGQKGQNSVFKVGDLAPEISLPSPKDEIINLSSTRGKIVLLDFWASWCSPCRKENPNIVKVYNLYRSKGFQIFQVSLDKAKEDWIKGIEDDKLGQWIHVSDVKYWNSIVVTLYKIESIPYNLLLDKDGKVLATNLRGNALQEKLGEIFN